MHSSLQMFFEGWKRKQDRDLSSLLSSLLFPIFRPFLRAVSWVRISLGILGFFATIPGLINIFHLYYLPKSIVLHITIHITKTIIYVSDNKAYVRHGVQNLPCNTDEKLLRLKMDKGVASYEDEVAQCTFDEIKTSNVLSSFIAQTVPQTAPYDWLRSQRIMNQSAKITVAGVMLYDECPQAILPKQSAVRILRYHTDEKEGSRQTLEDGFPLSIEGDAYTLIRETVSKVREIVESTSVVGQAGIEAKKYPIVTLHEIITNAVLHRDYSILRDIQVRIFTNRIEIESPGLLPGHITLDNILYEQFSRNPRLV